jgi:outer membrane protein OmpA-like peptidoglycan-associated protein
VPEAGRHRAGWLPGDRQRRDTFLDNVDKCPYEAGVAPDGCPLPDKDKDGFLDPDDKCPEEPGIAPDGCPPPPDSDGDGIIDKDDDCPLVPENYNGYKDKDGCVDELPKEIKYDGRPIDGIFFEFNKDKIQKKSFKTLDAAIVVLKTFDDIRIEVSGHTDDVGSEEANLDLSKRRAESVKQYMVDKGIDASRIETVGYGRSKPIDPGKSAKARAKNRRIEFRVIVVDKTGTATVMPNKANDADGGREGGEGGATTPGGEPKAPAPKRVGPGTVPAVDDDRLLAGRGAFGWLTAGAGRGCSRPMSRMSRRSFAALAAPRRVRPEHWRGRERHGGAGERRSAGRAVCVERVDLRDLELLDPRAARGWCWSTRSSCRARGSRR